MSHCNRLLNAPGRFTLLAVILFSSTPCALTRAAPLQLGSEIANAGSEVKSAYDSFTDALSAVNKVLQGHTPSYDPDWTKIADEYDQAAKDAETALLPSDLIPRDNIVSLNDVLDCKTRQAALAKLNAYFSELQETKNNGQQDLKKINQWLAEVTRSQQILKEIQNDYDKLVLVPTFGDNFKLAWLDVHSRIPRSLNGLRSALQKQKAKFTDDLAKLDTSIANYQSNLQLAHLPPCTPTPGPTDVSYHSYSGSGSAFSVDFGYWRTTMDHIDISFTYDPSGRMTYGRVDADHHERVVSGNPGPPIPDNHHSYKLSQGSVINNRVTAAFYSVVGSPRCSVSFVGNISGSSLTGTIYFARQDKSGILNWSGRSNVH